MTTKLQAVAFATGAVWGILFGERVVVYGLLIMAVVVVAVHRRSRLDRLFLQDFVLGVLQNTGQIGGRDGSSTAIVVGRVHGILGRNVIVKAGQFRGGGGAAGRLGRYGVFKLRDGRRCASFPSPRLPADRAVVGPPQPRPVLLGGRAAPRTLVASRLRMLIVPNRDSYGAVPSGEHLLCDILHINGAHGLMVGPIQPGESGNHPAIHVSV